MRNFTNKSPMHHLKIKKKLLHFLTTFFVAKNKRIFSPKNPNFPTSQALKKQKN